MGARARRPAPRRGPPGSSSVSGSGPSTPARAPRPGRRPRPPSRSGADRRSADRAGGRALQLPDQVRVGRARRVCRHDLQPAGHPQVHHHRAAQPLAVGQRPPAAARARGRHAPPVQLRAASSSARSRIRYLPRRRTAATARPHRQPPDRRHVRRPPEPQRQRLHHKLAERARPPGGPRSDRTTVSTSGSSGKGVGSRRLIR